MKKKVAFLIGMILLAALSLTPMAASAKAAVGYDSADFYGQASVILRADSAAALSSEAEGEPAASVWLETNASLEAVGTDGSVLGKVSDLLVSSTAQGQLAIVCPQDAAAYTALAGYLAETDIPDIAVASGDISVLMQASEASLRVVYIAGTIGSQSQMLTELGKANAVGAQTMVLEHEWADASTVRELQARFKAVWISTDGSAAEIADAIGRGAYGILTPDCAAVYDIYEKIGTSEPAEEGELQKMPSVLARAPFVAAHRGDWGVVYSENTVGAIKSAAENGATHAEIDIRLTADNEIVIYHNDNYTYQNVSQPVKSLTLAQLQENYLSDGISKIPTLDEVFTSLRNGDLGDMLLIIEFKGQEAELATLFAQKVQQYGVSDKIVVISFYPAQIMRVSESLPSVSTSLLLYTTDGDSALSQAAAVKSGIDMQRDNLRIYYGDDSISSSYTELFRLLADRGYSMWLWTYETASMNEAFRYGVTGITTNNCWYSRDMIEQLNVEKTMQVSSMPQEGSTMDISATTYKGETVTVPARVVYLEKGEEESKVLLIAQPETGLGLISECVTLRAETKGGAKGCGSAVAASAAIAAAALCGGAVLLLRKKA